MRHVEYDRARALDDLTSHVHDVLIVGGGINGAVAARACAARGLKVAMIDAADYASQTSQESSNLIWGGFKYLEGYELGLVAGLCRSRNELARAYPSQIQPLRFLAALGKTSPYSPGFATLGAYAYWGIGRGFTDRPRHASSDRIAATEPAVATDGVRGGIEYSDFYLPDNDARFVFSFVADATRDGATTLNYVRLASAERAGGIWRSQVVDELTGLRHEVESRVVVNATGPRAVDLSSTMGVETQRRILLSKGIHLVVPQITRSGRVLAFYDDDERLFYVIPMANRSVIGTTDTRVVDAEAGVTDEDRAEVLEQANARLDLATPLTTDDIISERCGVRSLIVDSDGAAVEDADWTSLSRKHAIEVDRDRAVVTILGGKLSDCINVGEGVLDACRTLGLRVDKAKTAWFGEAGAEARSDFMRAAAALGLGRPAEVELHVTVADLLWRRYGLDAYEVLDTVREDPTTAHPIAPLTDISTAEVQLMSRRDQIVHADDFLRRRTKIGLLNTAAQIAASPGVVAACELVSGGPVANTAPDAASASAGTPQSS
jgi:glycerol-3-phosphate dehydrogenase